MNTPIKWRHAPRDHRHGIEDVDGLVDALALKADTIHPALYESGWRDITSLVPVPVASGRLLIARFGSTVWLDFDSLLTVDPPANSWHTWSGVIPAGFRVHRNWPMVPLAPTWSGNSNGVLNDPAQASGPVRPATSGHVVVYGAKDRDGAVRPIQGLVSWPTLETPPATRPGTPA